MEPGLSLVLAVCLFQLLSGEVLGGACLSPWILLRSELGTWCLETNFYGTKGSPLNATE